MNDLLKKLDNWKVDINGKVYTISTKNITPVKINLINEFFRKTGILLDPTYTGKAFFAYYENFIMPKKCTKVMFLHTGGIFGAFAKKKNYLD